MPISDDRNFWVPASMDEDQMDTLRSTLVKRALVGAREHAMTEIYIAKSHLREKHLLEEGKLKPEQILTNFVITSTTGELLEMVEEEEAKLLAIIDIFGKLGLPVDETTAILDYPPSEQE